MCWAAIVFFHLCPIKSYVSRDNATHPVPCKELPQAAYFVKINYSCSLYYGSQSVLVSKNITRSCIMHRQPAPDPGGSCTGSRLSLISWHLNLPLNLTLSLRLTITLNKLLVAKKRKIDRQISNRLNVDAILTTLACRQRGQSPSPTGQWCATCQPIIVTAGARSPGIGCRCTIHYNISKVYLKGDSHCALVPLWPK